MDALTALIFKGIGSLTGAIMALVFITPKTRAEAIRRLVTSIACGVIFEHIIRSYFAWPDDSENVIAAASAAAFISWWLMGAIVSVARTWKGPQSGN